MTAKVGRVDHPVIAVKDLKQTKEQFQKLGFIVPPIGQHQEWGTENLCIMFPNDYLEIRGVNDPNKFLAGVDDFLKNGQGFYSVAFNSKSAEESYAEAVKSGIEIKLPKHLNRKLVLEDKVLDLHFKTVMLDSKYFPGLTHANLCEHLTFDTLRQPEWLDHPNGVVSFGRLTGVVKDFDAAESIYSKLLGAENVHREQDRITLTFGIGADIELIDEEEAARRGDNHEGRGEDYLASATLLVKDLAVAKSTLEQNGIRFQETKTNLIRIDPRDACGSVIYFSQE